jgi:hypothetical protein
MRRAAALALVGVLAAAPAGADLVRGTIKIDVRDPDGAPREAADVRVQPAQGGEAFEAARVGDVYVADGVVGGEWQVLVDGAGYGPVRLRGRGVTGAVVVLGEPAPPEGQKKPKKRPRKAPPRFTVTSDEAMCDDKEGEIVEAVAFDGAGRLAAGRLEVLKGKTLVCAATIAGGGASLRLKRGRYRVAARLVGGNAAQVDYLLPPKGAPPPLVLRAGRRK